MRKFRVHLIADNGEVAEERELQAESADDAACEISGESIKRYSRGSRKTLRVKVYNDQPSGTTLIRYYAERLALPS
jgi:hypothetical protein